jgi:hypothetical protein
MIYYGIASYHRPECRTYKTLIDMGIPRENITISLNDLSDYEEYKKRYPETRVIYREGNCVACNRNNLLDNHRIGTKLIILDDDIISFRKWTKENATSKYGKLVKLDKKEFEEILEECFSETIKIGNNKFGNYAISNTMMIKGTIESQGIYSVNKMFQGCFCGFIVDKESRFNEEYKVLDDYELILRDIKKGKYILRRNDLVSDTPKMGTSTGGYYDLYKQGIQEKYMSKLLKEYPNMFKAKKNCSGIILKKGL